MENVSCKLPFGMIYGVTHRGGTWLVFKHKHTPRFSVLGSDPEKKHLSLGNRHLLFIIRHESLSNGRGFQEEGK